MNAITLVASRIAIAAVVLGLFVASVWIRMNRCTARSEVTTLDRAKLVRLT